MRDQKLEWLEVMRGFAAIWVVLHHANQSIAFFLRPLGEVPLIANGFLGVDFFFVLSGFIIAFSSNRLIEQGKGFRSYFQARMIRIYVPYLPIGVVIYFLYLLLPALSASDRAPGIITSVLLIPTNSSPALSVAWTLIHEMIFYAVFSLIFISKRLLWGVLLCWVAVISASAYAGIVLSRFESYFLSPLNLCFLLGILVFYCRGWKMPTQIAGLASIFGLIAVLGTAAKTEPNHMIAGVGFALLVAAATSPYGAKLKVWSFATSLGAASYAIYLLHNPLLSLAVRGLRVIDASLNPWLGLLAISIFSVVMGLLYWFFYERRALCVVRNILSRTDLRPPRQELAKKA